MLNAACLLLIAGTSLGAAMVLYGQEVIEDAYKKKMDRENRLLLVDRVRRRHKRRGKRIDFRISEAR